MKNDCSVIGDLLPLYLDGVCSPASREFVEAHIADCAQCRRLLEEMRAELPEQMSPPILSGEDVLKRTAWTISKRAIGAAVGVTAIVLYWLVYFWQDNLANAGDYRYFSYTFHEAYTIGHLMIPVLTLVWLALLLWRAAKGRTWRKNAVLLVALAALLAGQTGYLYRQSQTVSTTCWTEVAEIPDPYHIVIEHGTGEVTLATTPIVTTLLKTDGTVYGFHYESRLGVPGQGKLHGIWDVVEKASD